jgi:hypothetical protein
MFLKDLLVAANSQLFFASPALTPECVELSLTQSGTVINGHLTVGTSHIRITQKIQPGCTQQLTRGIVNYLNCFPFENDLKPFRFTYSVNTKTSQVEYPISFNSICGLIEPVLSPLKTLEFKAYSI